MNDKFDLSKLAPAAAQSASPGTAGASVSYVRDVDEAGFEAIASQSLQFPVVLELTLSNQPGTKAVDDALIELTNQAEGRWLLGRVDVATSPRIAQALGVQAVPTVLAIIGGQVAPLFQGTRDKAGIKAILDQLAGVAIANGVTGRAQPVPGGRTAGGGDDATAQPEAGAEPAVDPRFAAADAALERGDLDAALAEFDKLLVANPRDAEAAAGKSQVGLLLRVNKLDPTAVLVKAGAAIDDLDAQLEAADVEMATGQPEAAFKRLVDAVRRTSGDDRERARVRLVELFSLLPPGDPTVAKARRDLTTALF